jgi:nitrogen regulatory protein P-II 1
MKRFRLFQDSINPKNQMKKVEAKIRKSKFKKVKESLIDAGFEAFSYHLTRSISKKSEERYDRVDLSIYVDPKEVSKVLDIILESGITGDASDSFIGVFDISQTYVVRHINGKDKLVQK